MPAERAKEGVELLLAAAFLMFIAAISAARRVSDSVKGFPALPLLVESRAPASCRSASATWASHPIWASRARDFYKEFFLKTS